MQATTSDPIDQQRRFLDSFDDYAFGLAASGDPKAIERLFFAMPFLLTHHARRPQANNPSDWRWLSLPWAVFADAASYTAPLRACMRVLRDAGFQPDALFLERLIRRTDLAMLEDVCEVFALDATTVMPDTQTHLLMLAADQLDATHGLAQFRWLLDRASDVDARCRQLELTTLYSVFTRGASESGSARERCALEALNWLLEAGASPNVEAIMNGWAHNGGKGERLPLLHAVYWCRYTSRTTEALVALAEKVCDPTQLDSQGRTALAYSEWLVRTQAQK